MNHRIKENLVYISLTLLLVVGSLVIAIGIFWFFIALTKITLAEALFKWPTNLYFLTILLGVSVIIGSILFLAIYEKKMSTTHRNIIGK